LINRVEQGEKIQITKHGKPVAVLSRTESKKNKSTAEQKKFVENLFRLRKELNIQIGDLDIKALAHEGHKW